MNISGYLQEEVTNNYQELLNGRYHITTKNKNVIFKLSAKMNNCGWHIKQFHPNVTLDGILHKRLIIETN